jgi:hypothetical protein
VSFLLDPPLLVATGAVIERTSPSAAAARLLSFGTTALVVGVSAALYANAPGLGAWWKPFGARSGREFMLGSGLVRVDDKRMSPVHHAAALSLFALYPAWLALGRRVVR